ncbi:type I restriction endonuclease subunit R, EcoR124 family [Candidatus Methanomassiliicoccus intestinalis]|uniref:type I restriction endonuclease subunit R, EcoR124 family n=1 Tax=Candidatus Methanomassiliicoccus intestinalis TaxID=1406512 RepID=UPI0037DD18A4
MEQKGSDLSTIIAEEHLKPEETRKYLGNSFRSGMLKTIGTSVDLSVPSVSRFGSENRLTRKQNIIKYNNFLDKYSGLI